MTSRVKVDLNVRVRGNQTYSGLEDAEGPLAVGQRVEVHEPESGLVGDGQITEIDTVSQLVYLNVDWASLREDLSFDVEGLRVAAMNTWPRSSDLYAIVSTGGTVGVAGRTPAPQVTQILVDARLL